MEKKYIIYWLGGVWGSSCRSGLSYAQAFELANRLSMDRQYWGIRIEEDRGVEMSHWQWA